MDQTVRAQCASASAPLGDPRIRIGVSFLHEEGPSQLRNAFDGTRGERASDAFRVQFRILPSERADLLVTLSEHRFREAQGVTTLPADVAAFNRLIAASGRQVGRYEVAHDHRGQRETETSAQSVRLKWLADAAEWTLVAARRAFLGPYRFDLDQTPLPAPVTPGAGVPLVQQSRYDTENDYFELRAQSRAGGAGTWRVGLSYSAQDARVQSDLVFPSGFGALAAPGTNARIIDFDAAGRGHALYGEGTLRFLGDRLGLTAGTRWEQTRRAATFLPGHAVFGGPAAAATVEDSRWLPKVGADWRFNTSTTAYTHVATGWRPGAVNLYRAAGDPMTHRSERSTTVEAGFRRQLVAGGGEVRASVYRTRVRDFQEIVFTSGSTGYTVNAPEVDIRGMEAEAHWAASRSLDLVAGLGITRGQFRDYLVPGTGIRLDGYPLSNVPEWNAFVSARWRIEALRLGADLIAADGFNAIYQNPAAAPGRIGGHAVLNLSAGLDRGHWSVTAFLNNVTDRRHLLNSYFPIAGGQIAVGAPGQPRIAGVQVRWRM